MLDLIEEIGTLRERVAQDSKRHSALRWIEQMGREEQRARDERERLHSEVPPQNYASSGVRASARCVRVTRHSVQGGGIYRTMSWLPTLCCRVVRNLGNRIAPHCPIKSVCRKKCFASAPPHSVLRRRPAAEAKLTCMIVGTLAGSYNVKRSASTRPSFTGSLCVEPELYAAFEHGEEIFVDCRAVKRLV